ncbi:hypothetical protein IX51_05265 [uncultured archaeon]|nr:hypothetical protein IX51_05265 [uncultured archaeon]
MKIGTFLTLGSPEICEMLGNEIDFAVIDAEHGVLMDNTLISVLRAIPSEITPWVRVKRPELASLALDLGAKAILIPQVRSMQDLNSAVESFYYPPKGQRGWGPGRVSRYGMDMMKIIQDEAINELWVQIETREALEMVEDIAAREEIDGLFVGPGDLSLALGHPGEWSNEELKSSTERIFEASRKNGKKFGIFTGNPAQVSFWDKKGADLVVFGADSIFFIEGYRNLMKEAGRQ